MSALLIIASLIIPLFGGWGVSCIAQPEERSLAARLVPAWLLGTLVLSILLALLGCVLSGWSLVAAVSLITALPGIMALRRPVRTAWPMPRGFVEWALCAVILLQCALLARFAWTTALGWDGLVVWETKARIAFANGGSLPLEYFSDATRGDSHPDYPLMTPLLETWVYLWLGASDQVLGRVIFPGFYLAALFLLYTGVARATGRRWAGLVTAALLFFIPFITAGQVNVFTGYADFPLATLYLAAVISLFEYIRRDGSSNLTLFAIYAGAMPWMKREGSILWLCLMLVAGVEFLRRREVRLALAAAVPGVVVIIGWKLAVFAVRAIPARDFMPLTVKNVVDHLDRARTIADDALFEWTSISDWSVLWIMFPVALAVLVARGKRALSARLFAIVAIPTAIYSGIYILSTWHPYEAHINCSYPRLLSHVSLVALLALGYCLALIVGPAAET